jgi:hypothetical protein
MIKTTVSSPITVITAISLVVTRRSLEASPSTFPLQDGIGLTTKKDADSGARNRRPQCAIEGEFGAVGGLC